MKTQKEIILKPDGTITRRTVSEEDVNVGDAIIASLCSDVKLKARSVFKTSNGLAANMCLIEDEIYLTVALPSLPLKAPFKIKDGILYPKFSAAGEPVMPMVWLPPEGMRIAMLVLVRSVGDSAGIINQWLFAFGADERAYRLPLGNLYDDARLCNGEIPATHPTIQAAVYCELEQLAKGQWNGDLDRTAEQAKSLFRFKPLNDKFEQLPPLAGWETLCEKISTATLDFVVL